MRIDINRADVFKETSHKKLKDIEIMSGPVPAWAKKKITAPKGKDLKRAQELGRVPSNLQVPGWKGRKGKRSTRKK